MHVIHRTAIASLEMPVDWLKRLVNMMVHEVLHVVDLRQTPLMPLG